MHLTQVLTDQQGNLLGELREASDRLFSWPLMKIPTVTGTIKPDNPMAEHIVKKEQTWLKVYDDWSSGDGSKTLRHVGPIVNYEKNRDSGTGSIAYTSAGPAWRLGKRLIGKDKRGATLGTDPANPATWLDRAVMASQIIQGLDDYSVLNLYCTAYDIHIVNGTITPTGSLAPMGPYFFKYAIDAITELAAPLDGFEWEVQPIEPQHPDPYNTTWGLFNAGPSIGSLKQDTPWQYGAGRLNVASWTDKGDDNALANGLAVLPPGYPDTAQDYTGAEDDVSVALRGWYEDAITVDYDDPTLRRKLAEEHVRIRANGTRIITFQPTPQDDPPAGLPRRVPLPFVDYIVGDIMPFQATEQVKQVDAITRRVVGYKAVQTVDELFRCYGLQLAVNDDEQITPTLTMVADAA